jgi:hypothetical protein
VPVPRAVTLTALNEQLLEGCRRRLGDRLRGHEETIGERLMQGGPRQLAIASALSRHRLFGADCLWSLRRF